MIFLKHFIHYVVCCQIVLVLCDMTVSYVKVYEFFELIQHTYCIIFLPFSKCWKNYNCRQIISLVIWLYNTNVLLVEIKKNDDSVADEYIETPKCVCNSHVKTTMNNKKENYQNQNVRTTFDQINPFDHAVYRNDHDF